MIRLSVLLVLAWGLLSCRPDGTPPGSTAPILPPPVTQSPGVPSPTIEVPPPI